MNLWIGQMYLIAKILQSTNHSRETTRGRCNTRTSSVRGDVTQIYPWADFSTLTHPLFDLSPVICSMTVIRPQWRSIKDNNNVQPYRRSLMTSGKWQSSKAANVARGLPQAHQLIYNLFWLDPVWPSAHNHSKPQNQRGYMHTITLQVGVCASVDRQDENRS